MTKRIHTDLHGQLNQAMRDCIEVCQACHNICLETLNHCLHMGGEHAQPSHIRTLLDCAQVCETSADFMLRSSDFHPQTCGVCAVVCEACAQDCERFKDDKMMMECARLCRECAQSCREMAGSGHVH